MEASYSRLFMKGNDSIWKSESRHGEENSDIETRIKNASEFHFLRGADALDLSKDLENDWEEIQLDPVRNMKDSITKTHQQFLKHINPLYQEAEDERNNFTQDLSQLLEDLRYFCDLFKDEYTSIKSQLIKIPFDTVETEKKIIESIRRISLEECVSFHYARLKEAVPYFDKHLEEEVFSWVYYHLSELSVYYTQAKFSDWEHLFLLLKSLKLTEERTQSLHQIFSETPSPANFSYIHWIGGWLHAKNTPSWNEDCKHLHMLAYKKVFDNLQPLFLNLASEMEDVPLEVVKIVKKIQSFFCADKKTLNLSYDEWGKLQKEVFGSSIFKEQLTNFDQLGEKGVDPSFKILKKWLEECFKAHTDYYAFLIKITKKTIEEGIEKIKRQDFKSVLPIVSLPSVNLPYEWLFKGLECSGSLRELQNIWGSSFSDDEDVYTKGYLRFQMLKIKQNEDWLEVFQLGSPQGEDGVVQTLLTAKQTLAIYFTRSNETPRLENLYNLNMRTFKQRENLTRVYPVTLSADGHENNLKTDTWTTYFSAIYEETTLHVKATFFSSQDPMQESEKMICRELTQVYFILRLLQATKSSALAFFEHLAPDYHKFFTALLMKLMSMQSKNKDSAELRDLILTYSCGTAVICQKNKNYQTWERLLQIFKFLDEPHIRFSFQKNEEYFPVKDFKLP